ncbi:MAG: amidohydrolase family protein [Gemmatimonadetes bacterium]|nr:amidohydrolase family protein [Gemmatimonadota bacterium]
MSITKYCACLAALGALGCAGATPPAGGDPVDPTVTLAPPGGTTRVIEFTTEEGTGMSVDVAPDGSWLAFDLLGHLYRVPIAGGEAVALTQNSGPALNFHPAISPDGRRIAFASDRDGQLGIWSIAADGSDPRRVHGDPDVRFIQPTWAPDGGSIVAVRLNRTPGRGWHRQNRALFRLPIAGGEPTAIVHENLTQPDAPAFSADGGFLYYQVSYSIDEGLGMLTAGHRIARRELASGADVDVRQGGPAEPGPRYREALRRGTYAGDVEGDEPAALTPKPSPDGKLLAFAREMPGETFEYRGHRMRPRTALWIRDLATGAERVLVPEATKDLSQTNTQYAYRGFPGYAWTPDSKAIVLTLRGKLAKVDVATGAVADIPFTARVRRVVAEPVRGNLTIADDSLEVRFLQWPVSSPDGGRLAFVAVGKVWVMDLPNGQPTALAAEGATGFALTPSWSTDGGAILFATWSVTDRGHVWRVPARGGAATRLTARAGEYLGPIESADGRSIAVTVGPGTAGWNGWDQLDGWRIAVMPAEGGVPKPVAAAAAWAPPRLGPDGRIVFGYQEKPRFAFGELYRPFPHDDALAQRFLVRSIDWSGGEQVDHAVLPARRDHGNMPALSLDGSRIAFDGAHEIYLASLPEADTVPAVETNPNVPMPGRDRIGDWGGFYPRWRSATQLEFVSGRRYVRYDAVAKRVEATEVRLRVPRRTPAGSIALVGAKIVTVDSQGVIDRGTIVVRGARITCVGSCDTAGVDRVVAVTGKTIIPGLVDLHAHHSSEISGVIPNRRSESALDLAYGVTTAVDPATTSLSAFPLAELIEAGAMVGPRTLSSAETVIAHGIAWGDHAEIESLDEARRQVNKRAEWGAATIKNYRQPGRRQHQWLAQAARERGISLTSEGGPLYLDVGYAIDGQSGWEHFIADLPIYRDAAEFFGKAGLVYSPTVIVAGVPNGAMLYYRSQVNLLDDRKYRRFMPYPLLAAKMASPPAAIEEMAFPILAEGVADIVRQGGYAAIGEHGEQIGIGSHWELWAYSTGLTPLEAIKIATYDGAYFIGAHREIGSIAAGKIADLAILDADPTVDIRNSAKVGMTMMAGRLYDAATLDELWPARTPYGPIPWPTGPGQR